MNTITTGNKEEARAELMSMAIKGTVFAATGLFCGLLEGLATMADERRAAEKAERVEILRTKILAGERMRLWEMASIMKRIDVSVGEVAEYTGLPKATVKKAVRRWYMFS